MKLYTITATPYQVRNKSDKNASLVACYPSNVAKILKKHGVDGFTIYKVHGYWEGKSEPSFKIEIATDGGVGMIASELRDKYNQDAVMVTYPDNTVEFI